MDEKLYNWSYSLLREMLFKDQGLKFVPRGIPDKIKKEYWNKIVLLYII